jgi:hypothetical protein
MDQDLEVGFEKLLKEIGYEDQLPIYPQEGKRINQVIYKSLSGEMSIYTFIILYQTKKSYLYLEYLDNIDCPNLNQILKNLAEKIYFHEKTRIMEVGWEIVYSKNPQEFTLEERKKILYSFIKDTHNHLKNGMVKLKPQVGDILVAKPYGPKINEGFTEKSFEIGKYQRSIVAKKFGFGELYEDGFQYARYDENLILRSI